MYVLYVYVYICIEKEVCYIIGQRYYSSWVKAIYRFCVVRLCFRYCRNDARVDRYNMSRMPLSDAKAFSGLFHMKQTSTIPGFFGSPTVAIITHFINIETISIEYGILKMHVSHNNFLTSRSQLLDDIIIIFYTALTP